MPRSPDSTRKHEGERVVVEPTGWFPDLTVDPDPPPVGPLSPGDDTPLFTQTLLNRLLDRLSSQDTALARIAERLDTLMADFATAAADVAAFIAAAEAKWDAAMAEVADLKSKLAAAPSTDPGVQEAADKIEAALNDGKAHLALAAPTAGADTTAPAGATATPDTAAPADAPPVVSTPSPQPAQTPVPSAPAVPADQAQPAAPAPAASPAPAVSGPAGAAPDPAHPGAVVTAAPAADAADAAPAAPVVPVVPAPSGDTPPAA